MPVIRTLATILLFLSTLSLRRATATPSFTCIVFSISIHALLAESDLGAGVGRKNIRTISIHALLAESDLAAALTAYTDAQFLSTLSLRRATVSAIDYEAGTYISIHALLAESDCINLAGYGKLDDFYPRSPCGERPPWRPR